MSGIGISGMDEIDERIDKVLKEFPEERRLLHEASGKVILGKVLENTPYDAKRKKGTHLKDAITMVVGSKGGYTAVRADEGKSPHAHLVENGHVQKDKNGTPTGTFVPGKHMFKIASMEAKGEVLKLTEEFSNKIIGDLT
jgi:hypothetical protein